MLQPAAGPRNAQATTILEIFLEFNEHRLLFRQTSHQRTETNNAYTTKKEIPFHLLWN